MDFLQNTYLYHFGRKDHRHNFSVYFYYFYLISETSLNSAVAWIAFLPQFLLVAMSSLVSLNDILFAVFLQTFLFVSFNKVCTSQVSNSSTPIYIPFSKLLHPYMPSTFSFSFSFELSPFQFTIIYHYRSFSQLHFPYPHHHHYYHSSSLSSSNSSLTFTFSIFFSLQSISFGICVFCR